MDKIESRFLDAGKINCEVREKDENGKELIRFDPIQYNVWSEVLGGFFREIIEPGAADHLLNSGEVYSVINHDNNLILGRQSNNRLKLERAGDKIIATVDPPDGLSYVNDLKINIREKNIIGASYRFTVNPEDETWDTSKDIYERRIKKFSGLFEVGPVTNPAYRGNGTRLEKRDVDQLNYDHQAETENLNDEVTCIFIDLL